jgi:hypothetical protein
MGAEPSKTQLARYLTDEEAGSVPDAVPRTLEKQRAVGGGPSFRKLGRRVVYALEDRELLANARACDMTSDPSYSDAR